MTHREGVSAEPRFATTERDTAPSWRVPMIDWDKVRRELEALYAAMDPDAPHPWNPIPEPATVTVTKLHGVVDVPRELAIEYGLVEPTPAERAELERDAAESRRRHAVREAKLAAARTALAGVTDPLARAVLDLHAESDAGECRGCEVGGYEPEQPDWPCETTELIARHYGIEVP